MMVVDRVSWDIFIEDIRKENMEDMKNMEQSPIVRNVGVDDYSVLRSLAFQCEPLDHHTPYTYWVCCNYFSEWGFILELADEPIGYIMAISTEDKVFIWQIAVLPKFQKRGYASLLIEAVVKKMKEKGYYTFQTTIAPTNERSQKAFEHFTQENGILKKKVGAIHIIDAQENILSDEDEMVYEFTL